MLDRSVLVGHGYVAALGFHGTVQDPIMTVHDIVAHFFDRLAFGSPRDLVELCDREVVVDDSGREYRGADGLRQWQGRVAGARYVVREVAGEPGEIASASVTVVDSAGSARRSLLQARLGVTERITQLTIRPAGTPVQTIALLSARPMLDHEAFVDYYETHHVPLIRSLAPVPLRYTRTYLPAADERRFPADFDVVTQMRFADAEAWAEWLRLVTADGSGVPEDEARFLDRDRTRSWSVRVEGDPDTG